MPMMTINICGCRATSSTNVNDDCLYLWLHIARWVSSAAFSKNCFLSLSNQLIVKVLFQFAQLNFCKWPLKDEDAAKLEQANLNVSPFVMAIQGENNFFSCFFSLKPTPTIPQLPPLFEQILLIACFDLKRLTLTKAHLMINLNN